MDLAWRRYLSGIVLVSRYSSSIVRRMLLSLVVKVLFGERYDDFSRVLQSGIRLGHLLATPAASSSDWAHIFVINESQFSSHRLHLSRNPSLCGLFDPHCSAIKTDIVCSDRQLSWCLRDVGSHIFPDVELRQRYFDGSDHAGDFDVHALQNAF